MDYRGSRKGHCKGVICMTAREFLSRYSVIDRQIQSNLRQMKQLRLLSTDVSSAGFEQSYNPNKCTQDPFVKSIEAIEDMQSRIDEKVLELISVREDIIDAINAIGDIDIQEVLEYRYISQMTWDEIAKNLNVSERTARRRQEIGLDMIVVPEKYKN